MFQKYGGCGVLGKIIVFKTTAISKIDEIPS